MCTFYYYQSNNKRSAFLTTTKRARLKSNPGRVHFAESVPNADVTCTAVVSPVTPVTMVTG